jgi:hypothetical protein
MNWIHGHQTVAVPPEVVLRLEQKPYMVLNLRRLFKWLSTWRAKLATRGHVHPRMAPAHEKRAH